MGAQCTPGSSVAVVLSGTCWTATQPRAAARFRWANGSLIVGAPFCGAGVIGPDATPEACTSPAVTNAALLAITSLLPCNRQPVAVIRDWPIRWTLSRVVVPVVRTQSG